MNPRSEEDEDEELQYKIAGQDFIYDLLVILDILHPVIVCMDKLQSFSCPIWKTPKYLREVINALEAINVDTLCGLPRLQKHKADIENMMYSGVQLKPGYLVDKEVCQEVQESSTKRKKKIERTYHWTAREITECEKEAVQLIKDLTTSIKHREEKCVHGVSRTLERCLDFHRILLNVCGKSSNLPKPFNFVRLVKHGVAEFRALFTHVSKLTQMVDDESLCFDPALSEQTFMKIKSFLASII